MSESATKPEQPALPTKEELMAYLYNKTYVCPVCQKQFEDTVIRRSKLRKTYTEIDFRSHYKDIDPNLYEIAICTFCGYGAMANYFDRITPRQQEWIEEKITPNYKYKEYDLPLSPADAMDRYKHALACAQVINAKASIKAIMCLKMSWIYRDAKDEKAELTLLKFAYSGLKEAYTTENFPLGTMDENTTRFIIAEMARRLGDFDEALRMISDVITSRTVPSLIKERAQDLKELIKEKNSALV